MPITVLSRLPRILSVAGFSAVVVLAGCEQAKTKNPLSPLIAGPIEGVDITLPKTLEPGTGWKIEDQNQPITLLIENPSTTSPRPYTLRVQLATDAGFTNLVFSTSGLAPGSNGRTSFRLPDRVAPGTYRWRARAEDGANSSDWSPAAVFEVLQPVSIGTPTPKDPIGNVRVTTRTPTLVATNGNSSGPHGPLFYLFQLSNADTFGALTGNAEAPQNASGTTSYAIPSNLPYDMVLYWRVRITDGKNTGPWSRTETFRTPIAPVTPPPPPPGPPGGGGGGAGSCAFNNGEQVVQCIAAKYPSYLAAGVSLDERIANMAFLRDRVIESGICGGLDLAWNKKRGDGPHSIDALAWRTGAPIDEVVDIGAAYDDTSKPLQLMWAIVLGPPGYDPYPKPDCSK